MKDTINTCILNSMKLNELLLNDSNIHSTLINIVDLIVNSYKKSNKVLFCGNGGSAADAQHIAAELSGRFYKDREPLYAEALHVNSSFVTAVANDYGFDHVYSRMIEACGKKGDVFFAISTSGNSKNIVNALIKANEMGLVTIGLTGNNKGKLNDYCDFLIEIPSIDTPRIQESHILIGHIICQLVEEKMFPDA
mgnify:FL=1